MKYPEYPLIVSLWSAGDERKVCVADAALTARNSSLTFPIFDEWIRGIQKPNGLFMLSEFATPIINDD